MTGSYLRDSELQLKPITLHFGFNPIWRSSGLISYNTVDCVYMYIMAGVIGATAMAI